MSRVSAKVRVYLLQALLLLIALAITIVHGPGHL